LVLFLFGGFSAILETDRNIGKRCAVAVNSIPMMSLGRISAAALRHCHRRGELITRTSQSGHWSVSSEVGTGSHEEDASKQKVRTRVLIQSESDGL
jgi:hypothetical protein